MVKNIVRPAPQGYGPVEWNVTPTAAGSRVFFDANDGVHGDVMWVSDGTEAGTMPLGNGYGFDLNNINGTLFFDGCDSAHGCELWKSDGTTGGTVLVKDLDNANTNSFPDGLVGVNGSVFFH